MDAIVLGIPETQMLCVFTQMFHHFCFVIIVRTPFVVYFHIDSFIIIPPTVLFGQVQLQF